MHRALPVGLFARPSLRHSSCAQRSQFTSPGLAPTRMDDQGRLVEDWGSITVNVAGAGLPATAPATLQSIKLDGLIPAAEAQSR